MRREMQKVLVPPRADMPLWETYRKEIERPDTEIVFAPVNFWQRPEDDRIRQLADIAAVIAGTEAYTERVFGSCPGLKIVARAGVGYDNVDLVAAARHRVWVTNTPGSLERSVAESTWMMILALTHKLEPHLQTMRNGAFEWVLGTEAFGRTLGIIGVGRIGRLVAQIARGFEMTLLGCDVVQDEHFAASTGLRYVSLRELLGGADIVTIHTPRLPETLGLIGAKELGWMKPTASLINTARGGIVDETALVAALREGRLAGAALDVFEKEPLPAEHPLRKLPNVVLTPHVAAATVEASRRTYLQAWRNVVAVLDGKRPPNPVNQVT